MMENWQFLYYLITGGVFTIGWTFYCLKETSEEKWRETSRFAIWLVGAVVFAVINATWLGPWLGF
jgi:hypothetical protein